MKFVVKPNTDKTYGYCFACNTQCQNNCGGQCANRNSRARK